MPQNRPPPTAFDSLTQKPPTVHLDDESRLIAFLVGCAAIGVAVVLARPNGEKEEAVKTVPAEVKGVEKGTEANAYIQKVT